MYIVRVRAKDNGYYDVIIYQNKELYSAERNLDWNEAKNKSSILAYYFHAQMVYDQEKK